MLLLERDGDLACLDALVARAAGGEGALLFVEGEAGAGKTALLGELRDRARSAGLAVRAGRGGELEQPFSYGVARQLLEPVLAGADAARRGVLTSGAAQHALLVLGEAPGDDEADSLRAHHGLHWLVVHLCDERPLALVVDDAHWADRSSLDWLTYLARRAGELPLLLAVAARPHAAAEAAHALDELAGDPLARTVVPRPLSAAAAAVLIAEEAGEAPDEDFVATAHRVTGGNPFYLRELVRAALDLGMRPHAAQAPRLEHLGPDRVSRSVGRRLRRAGPRAQLLARALAVLDGPAAPALAAAVAGLPEVDALDAAERLVRAGVAVAGATLDITHPVVRAAIADDTGLAQRADLHARAAAALLAEGAEAPRVAVHLLRLPPGSPVAGVEPVEVLRRAGGVALARGEPRAAVAWLRRALAERPAPAVGQEVLVLLARAELRVRDAQAFERLGQLVREAPDRAERVRVGLELSQRLSLEGAFAQAVDVAEELLADGEGAPGQRLLLETQRVAGSLMHAPRATDAALEAAALRARLEAGEPLHPAQIAIVVQAAGLFGVPGAPVAAWAARALADPRVAEIEQSGMLGALAHGLVLAGEPGLLEPLLGATLREARAAGDRTRLVWSHALRAQLRMARGEAADAEADVEPALELLAPQEASHALGWVLFVVVDVLTARGRAAEALALLDARAPAEPQPELYQFAMLDLARSAALLQLGRPDAALAASLRAAERIGHAPYAPGALPWRSALALCRRALGELHAARALAAEELARARDAGDPRAVGRALVVQARCAPPGEQLGHLEEAIAVLRTTDAADALARAQIEQGAALRRAGRRADARAALRDALDLGGRKGLVVLAAQARTELAATGARPRRERLDGPEALTASERRVVELAASGATNRAIAQELFLTQKTVETHLSSAYRKLDVSSRTQLAPVLATAS